MPETTHFIPVPAKSVMLSMEQVGRIRGYCDALRIVEPTKYNIEQLSISIELELNPSLRALRDLQQQADAGKACPAFHIQVELSRKNPDSEPGKAPASEKVPRTHTDAPPVPPAVSEAPKFYIAPSEKRKGMSLSQYIETLPLDAETDLRKAYLHRFNPPIHSAAGAIECLLTRPQLMGETMTQTNLAKLLHVSKTTISLALKGNVRPILKRQLADIIGWRGTR